MQKKILNFNKTLQADFITTLRKRVNVHFSENNIERHYNGEMVRKTIFMICLYLVPYGIILSGIFDQAFVLLFLWLIMALGMSGIGLSIMHDANHGAYSKNTRPLTAKEFDIPYYHYPTFFQAIIEHGKMMKMLGNHDQPVGVSASTGYHS